MGLMKRRDAVVLGTSFKLRRTHQSLTQESLCNDRLMFAQGLLIQAQIGNSRIRCCARSTVTMAPVSKCSLATGDSFYDNGPDRGGKNVLCSNLQHTWATRFARREEHPEIEIVGEDDESVGSGVVENP